MPGDSSGGEMGGRRGHSSPERIWPSSSGGLMIDVSDKSSNLLSISEIAMLRTIGLDRADYTPPPDEPVWRREPCLTRLWNIFPGVRTFEPTVSSGRVGCSQSRRQRGTKTGRLLLDFRVVWSSPTRQAPRSLPDRKQVWTRCTARRHVQSGSCRRRSYSAREWIGDQQWTGCLKLRGRLHIGCSVSISARPSRVSTEMTWLTPL